MCPQEPSSLGCTCCLASPRRNACAGKESAWELSGDFPGRAGIWEFSALPVVPSFLTQTLLPRSQTALKKATAHTMLFPSPEGAGDEIPHPAGDTELALCLGKALPGPASWSHTKGLLWPRAEEKDSGSYRCILPWACSMELCKKSVPLPHPRISWKWPWRC